MFGIKKHLLNPRISFLMNIFTYRASNFLSPDFERTARHKWVPFSPISILTCLVLKSIYWIQGFHFWWSFLPSGHLFFFRSPWFWPLLFPKLNFVKFDNKKHLLEPWISFLMTIFPFRASNFLVPWFWIDATTPLNPSEMIFLRKLFKKENQTK